jgi:hypothetical protein
MNEGSASESNLPESGANNNNLLASGPTNVETKDNSLQSSTESTNQSSTKNEPLSPDEMRKVINRESPSKCIRECLVECFDSESIIPFCQDYFSYVFKRLASSDKKLDYVISEIIKYCEQRGEIEVEYLWQKVKIERGDNYYKYYRRWQKAIDDSLEVGRVNIEEYAFRPSEDKKNTMESSQNNPLARSPNELTTWFFEQLDPKEQSLLLTTALFEGMGRQKLVQVMADIEQILSRQE